MVEFPGKYNKLALLLDSNLIFIQDCCKEQAKNKKRKNTIFSYLHNVTLELGK